MSVDITIRATAKVVSENLNEYLVSPDVMKTIEAKVVESAKEAIINAKMEPLELYISVKDCSKCKHPNDPKLNFATMWNKIIEQLI
jgi:hypothetical protein